jgi:hypothetical protein
MATSLLAAIAATDGYYPMLSVERFLISYSKSNPSGPQI